MRTVDWGPIPKYLTKSAFAIFFLLGLSAKVSSSLYTTILKNADIIKAQTLERGIYVDNPLLASNICIQQTSEKSEPKLSKYRRYAADGAGDLVHVRKLPLYPQKQR